MAELPTPAPARCNHPRGAIAEPRNAANVTRNGAYGALRVNRTSNAPRGSTFAIRLNHDLNGAAVPDAVSRSYQNLTSSASKRLPSCHLTPRRSVKLQVVGLVFAQDSARHGTIFRRSSNITRLWYARSPQI